MTSNEQSFPRGNPFATRYVRPGAVPYFFPAGDGLDEVIQRLQENSWRGEIVGPHGTGKSTLVAELIPRLRTHERRILLVSLRDGQRNLPRETFDQTERSPADQWIIDGYEQLGWWARRRLHRHCARYGSGLLVTSHRETGLPVVWRTPVEAGLIRRIVEHLGRPREFGDFTMSDEKLSELIASHGGNVRELLFDMYDLFERGRRGLPVD